MIQLQVRRFFCRNKACGKKTFAEQLPGLTTRYGRWTAGLAGEPRAIALASGGRAGARPAGQLTTGERATTA